jgi:hypothetical protein
MKAMVLKMALKCSDIAHSAKALALHTKWSLRIIEEFYRQGDQELAAGLSISPFMDRRQPNISRAQIGFIDFLSMPVSEIRRHLRLYGRASSHVLLSLVVRCSPSGRTTSRCRMIAFPA